VVFYVQEEFIVATVFLSRNFVPIIPIIDRENMAV